MISDKLFLNRESVQKILTQDLGIQKCVPRWFPSFCQFSKVHTALDVKELLSKKQVTIVDHPPYSSDLTPCDFWIFLRLKSVIEGMHFGSVDEIEKTVTSHLTLKCLGVLPNTIT